MRQMMRRQIFSPSTIVLPKINGFLAKYYLQPLAPTPPQSCHPEKSFLKCHFAPFKKSCVYYATIVRLSQPGIGYFKVGRIPHYKAMKTFYYIDTVFSEI